MNNDDERAALALHLWDEGLVRPESLGLLIVDAILAAGYTKPRTITTVEELDALPKDAVVLSDGFAYQHVRGFEWDGLGRGWSSHQIDLPATILHIPEVPSD